MNERLTELYRSCRPKEALASQDQANSANVLLGSEVEQFAELIVRECAGICEKDKKGFPNSDSVKQGLADMIKQHFGVEE